MSQSSTSGIDQITFESTEVGVDGLTANHNLYSTTNHTSHQISERERPHVYYMVVIQLIKAAQLFVLFEGVCKFLL